MSAPPRPRGILRPHPIVAVVAFTSLALLLWCAGAYGYDRDELYLLACARRLAWGYVDAPPLAAGALSLVQRIYGETLLSIRLVPSLSGAVVVILTARLAARFGGRPLAQGLAALCVLFAPGLLEVGHTFSAASLQVVLWTATAGLLARAVTATREQSLLAWLRVGTILGLGCLDALTTVPFVFALAVGLASTPSRRLLRTRGPWLALGVAAVFCAPFLSWERSAGWPTLEYLTNVARERLAGATPTGYLAGLLEATLPVSVIVWGAGVAGFARGEALAEYRFLGVAFVVLFCVFLPGGRATAHLLLPAFPFVFAAGAATLDRALTLRRWGYPVVAGVIALTGLAALPLSLPLFRVAGYEAYARRLRIAPDDGALPRHFAAMYGWPELTHAVATVSDGLSYEDRRDAVVLAGNVGEAGALEMFGGLVNLPIVISGQDEFWRWGTSVGTGRVVLAVGVDDALLRASFRECEVATVFGHSLALPEERHVKIAVCKDSVEPLDAMWGRFRRYD